MSDQHNRFENLQSDEERSVEESLMGSDTADFLESEDEAKVRVPGAEGDEDILAKDDQGVTDIVWLLAGGWRHTTLQADSTTPCQVVIHTTHTYTHQSPCIYALLISYTVHTSCIIHTTAAQHQSRVM